MNNQQIIDKTVEITVARLSNTNLPIDADGGKNVADFMQAIFDKISELSMETR